MQLTQLLEALDDDGTWVGAKFQPDTSKQLKQWAEDNNIPEPLSEDDLHVTVVLHKTKKFPWKPKLFSKSIVVQPDTYEWKLFGKENNCLVLTFKSDWLTQIHRHLRKKHDLPWDFPNYTPHVSLSYDVPKGTKVKDLPVPDFPLVITHTVVEPFKDDLNEARPSGYLFHATTLRRLENISQYGLRPEFGGSGEKFGGGYVSRSKNRVFFARTPAGAAAWLGQIEDVMFHATDDEHEATVVMLRVPGREVHPDTEGTNDMSHESVFSTEGVEPEEIELWHPNYGWIPIESYYPDDEIMPPDDAGGAYNPFKDNPNANDSSIN